VFYADRALAQSFCARGAGFGTSYAAYRNALDSFKPVASSTTAAAQITTPFT
jgi:hypothetical protein